MGFLRVLNQMGDDEIGSMRCREIINTKAILHVYVRLPEEDSLCIEYMTPHGKVDIIEDHFECSGDCISRFYEIERILKEDK